MMERIELQAEDRTVQGKKVSQLRVGGWIPAVVYGPDSPSKSIQIEERTLYRTLQQAGSTALISLSSGEGEASTVLARDVQRDALTGKLLHVDFYEVRMTEKVKTMPRLELVGESPLVKTGTAVLIHGMTEVEVECLPTDLINAIEVDITPLETLDDSVLVGDLPVPPGVTILADPADVVVSLVTTRAALTEEEELEMAGEEMEAEEEAEEEE